MSEAWSEVKKSQLSNHHLEYSIDHIHQYTMDATLLNILFMIDRQFIMNSYAIDLSLKKLNMLLVCIIQIYLIQIRSV